MCQTSSTKPLLVKMWLVELITGHDKMQLEEEKVTHLKWEISKIEQRLDLEKIEVSLHPPINQSNVPKSSITLFLPPFLPFRLFEGFFPSFIHILSATLSLTLTHNLLVSPLTGKMVRNRIMPAGFSFWSANELIQAPEYVSSRSANPAEQSPSIYPLISKRRNSVFDTTQPHARRHDGKVPPWLSIHAFLYERLFTEGCFDTRCALISWWAQRVRVSEAQN